MNSPRQFEDYIKEGIVKKQSSNKPRAKFLVDESDKSYLGLKQRIEKIGINTFNANSIIKDCHDIMLELVRAKMLLEGYNASGLFAHEAEVSYMRNLGFSENEVSFMNELRFLRNGILYYGKILDEHYAQQVLGFLKRVYSKLKEKIKFN